MVDGQMGYGPTVCLEVMNNAVILVTLTLLDIIKGMKVGPKDKRRNKIPRKGLTKHLTVTGRILHLPLRTEDSSETTT